MSQLEAHQKTSLSKPKKGTKAKAKKPKPIPKDIRQRCLASFQKLRKLQETNDAGYVSCISCGIRMDLSVAQGGHYIPRGNRATEIEHDNVWPQCQRCNGFLNGNLILYRRNLVKRIGEARVKRLEDMAEAYRGDIEAMASLSEEDRIKVTEKKGKQYYLEKNNEFKEILKDYE